MKDWILTNLTAILGAALLASVLCMGWQRIEIANLELNLSELQLEVQKGKTAAEKTGRLLAEQYARGLEKAREDTKALQEKADHAIAEANQRTAAKERALAAANATSLGLQRTLDSVPERIRNASDAAVREYAATASAVLGECQGRYLEMATKAAGHAIDAQKLYDAWPVLPAGQQPSAFGPAVDPPK